MCCSLLFDTGLRTGLLSELGTPKQGDGWKEVLYHQHKAKPFLCGALVASCRECDMSTVDILTLEVHGARQQ